MLSGSAASAQDPQPLHGQLVEADRGAPIIGVPLRIEGTALQSLTDDQGRFSFAAVPTGVLVLVADDPSIEPVRVEVDPRTRDQHGTPREPLVVRTTYAPMPEFAATAVASRPRPRTASTTRLTARDLAALPHRNAEDALRLVPGLTLVQHGSEGKGHQFFLRGFDAIHGADLEITVEGLPVNEWSNVHGQGFIDLGFVIAEAIDFVEVTKGPFTPAQGAFAMAGSADYQLGIPAGSRGLRGTYTIGTTNRHRGVVTFSPRDGDGEDFVAVEALHDDGFGQRRAIDRGTILGRVRLIDSAEHGTLSLLLGGYLAGFALPGTLREEDFQSGRVDFRDAYERENHGRSGRGLVALAHEWHDGDHRLETLAYGGYRRLELLENYTGYLLDPVRGDRRHQIQDTWSFGATFASDLALTDTLGLLTGVGIRGDVFDQTQTHVDTDVASLATERALAGLQTITHLRLGLRWRPIDAVRLSAGARLDVVHVSARDRVDGDAQRSGTLGALSPRVVAEWTALPPWQLFAAYGRGFRPPEARAFTTFSPLRTGIGEHAFDGGEARMTISDALEIGTRWTPSEYFGLRLSGFATWIERESVFDHVSGVNLALGPTRRLGAELEVRSEPADWLAFVADVTYVDARFEGSDRVVPFAPPLAGSVRAVLDHESGFSAALRFMALAPRPLPHGARGAPLGVLDAAVGYQWRWLRIDLDVENLLNQRIREGEYHYASHWRPGEDSSELPVLHYVAGPPLNARLSLTVIY